MKPNVTTDMQTATSLVITSHNVIGLFATAVTGELVAAVHEVGTHTLKQMK